MHSKFAKTHKILPMNSLAFYKFKNKCTPCKIIGWGTNPKDIKNSLVYDININNKNKYDISFKHIFPNLQACQSSNINNIIKNIL